MKPESWYDEDKLAAYDVWRCLHPSDVPSLEDSQRRAHFRARFGGSQQTNISPSRLTNSHALPLLPNPNHQNTRLLVQNKFRDSLAIHFYGSFF